MPTVNGAAKGTYPLADLLPLEPWNQQKRKRSIVEPYDNSERPATLLESGMEGHEATEKLGISSDREVKVVKPILTH